MVNFGQASYIDGTVVPGSELRRNTQRDTGDGSGVVRPGDLKITQMDTPGAGVKIAVGDALIQSRAPGAGRETYGVPLVTAQNYMGDGGDGLPGTGSEVPGEGYRRDFVFLEVLDPGLLTWYTPKEEWPAGQTMKLSVVQNVGPTAKKMSDVPALANVTGEPLCAIKYPPSTSTVDDAMIEDLREVHSPRTVTEVRSFNLVGPEAKERVTAQYPAFATWPPQSESTGDLDVFIPAWATVMKIVMTVSGFVAPGVGNAYGRFAAQVGANVNPDRVVTQQTRWSLDGTAAAYRDSVRVADTRSVPASMRGTTQRIYPRANREFGTALQGIYADWATSVDFTVVFQESRD